MRWNYSSVPKVSPQKVRTLLLIGLGLVLGSFIAGLATVVPSLYAQATSPLTIQPDTGRVGIGTASPRSKLEIGGTGPGTLRLSENNDRYVTIEGHGAGDGSASLIFRRKDPVTGTPVETMRITSTGNVGIGATAPSFNRLRVSAAANQIGIEDNAGGTNRLWTLNADSNLLLFADETAAANRMVIDSTGNVGIGTTAPAHTLHVKKDPGGAAYVAVIENTNVDGYGLAVVTSGSTGTKQAFEVQSGVGSIFNVLKTGNVGIGTTTPTSRLHVNGTLTATTKNFSIPHPLDPVQKRLVHSALEGPEAAVYYRGAAQLQDGEIRVSLPPYFEALTRTEHRTVQLTPIDGWTPLYVVDGVQEGGFTVRTAENGNPTQRFYWEVKAIRADVPLLVAEQGTGTRTSQVQGGKEQLQ